MQSLYGADTLVPVTAQLVQLVRQRSRAMPSFWGRYFKRPGFEQDYQPATENAVFAAHHIRLLPIARQTNRVAGSATDGATDAILNVNAFVKSLDVDNLAAIGGELLMFLDVEGTSEKNPNLSLDYWIGWSSALVSHSRRVSRGRFTMVPALYCRQNQHATWDALRAADALGFPCSGAWVFRARTGACSKPVPGWDAAFNTPTVELPCPIMIWQFAIDCEGSIDYNLANPDPAIESALLNRLIVPGF